MGPRPVIRTVGLVRRAMGPKVDNPPTQLIGDMTSVVGSLRSGFADFLKKKKRNFSRRIFRRPRACTHKMLGPALTDQQKRAWLTCMDGIPGIRSPRAPLLRWWRRWFSDFARRRHGTDGSTETGLVNLYGWNSRNSLAARVALKDQQKRARYTLIVGNRRARVRAASPSRGLSRSPISKPNFSAGAPAPRAQYEGFLFMVIGRSRR
jgi:hypothetical protein